MMLVAGCRCSNKNTLNNLGEFTHDVQCVTMHVLCEIYLLVQCIARCPAGRGTVYHAVANTTQRAASCVTNL